MSIPWEHLLEEGVKITFGAILGALLPGVVKISKEIIDCPKVESAMLRCRKQNDAVEVRLCVRNLGKKACSLEAVILVGIDLNKYYAQELEQGGFMPPVFISSNSTAVIDVYFKGHLNDPKSIVLAFSHRKYLEIEIEENVVNKNMFTKNSILEAIAIVKDGVKPKFYAEKSHASLKDL